MKIYALIGICICSNYNVIIYKLVKLIAVAIWQTNHVCYHHNLINLSNSMQLTSVYIKLSDSLATASYIRYAGFCCIYIAIYSYS